MLLRTVAAALPLTFYRERLSSTGGWHVQYMRWFLKKVQAEI